jgi:hypothetical protein
MFVKFFIQFNFVLILVTIFLNILQKAVAAVITERDKLSIALKESVEHAKELSVILSTNLENHLFGHFCLTFVPLAGRICRCVLGVGKNQGTLLDIENCPKKLNTDSPFFLTDTVF